VDRREEIVTMPVTADQLAQLCPKADKAVLQALADALNAGLPAGGIDTNIRLRHFLAQCAHESQGLTRFEENLNYSAEGLRNIFPKYFDAAAAQQYARQKERIANRAYANRIGNGDEASGDGWRFRGRGIFQLTGRANYRSFGERVGVKLEQEPERAAEPAIAVQVAIAYWNDRRLSDRADADDIEGITRGINGGTIGLEERKKLLAQAKAIWP
jgi:putative chitinase